MFAFITLSLIVSVALAFIAARGMRDGRLSVPSVIGLGSILPLIAIGALGKLLSINDGSIGSIMVASSAIAISIIFGMLSARPKLVPIRVVAQRRRRPF